MSDATEYLDSKGLSYKIVEGANGKEAIVKTCPFCMDNKEHLYVNVGSGAYHCKKCSEGGSLLTLKKKFGDVLSVSSIGDFAPKTVEEEVDFESEVANAHSALWDGSPALRYLSRIRGFTREAINHFKLGYSEDFEGKWVWFPYFKDGVSVNVKRRSLPPAPKTYRRKIGRPSELYNADCLKDAKEWVIVCEGETDTVSVWGAGFHNVVGTSIGAKGVANDWVDKLDKFQRIYFVYDNDDVGQEGSYIFANRLGLERCYKIKIPVEVKDVNEFFVEGGTPEDFQRLIDKAKIFDVQHVSSLGEEIGKAFNRWSIKKEETNKLHLPWKKLDYLTDSFLPGDLIILSARPGVGKTSMALNFLYKFATQDVPVLLFELEMRPERILPRLVAQHLNRDSREVMVSDALQQAYTELKDTPLHFAYVYKKPNFEVCADTIRMCVRRYGVRFVVFDNLHFLCRSIADQTREVSVVVQGFKLLAEELAIPIMLIARPRKSSKTIITNEDLKDSADIEGDADIVILLHRGDINPSGSNIVSHEGIFSEDMLVKVSKCRYASGGDIYMKVNDKTCRMEEAEK